MKTKKLLIQSAVLSLFAVFAFQVNAQEQDPKAKAILDGVSTKTKTYKTIDVDFEYIMEDKATQDKRTLNGNLKLKGDKFVISQGENEIYYNGEEAWRYHSGDNEYEVLEKEDLPMNPSEIFTIYDSDYKFRFVKESTEGGKTIQNINLYPMNPEGSDFHRIELKIDKAKKQIIEFKTVNKNQVHFIYKVKSMKTDIPFEDTLFNFDEDDHPGSEEM